MELSLDTLAECNPRSIAVLEYFSIKSRNCYINGKTTRGGANNEFVTTQYGCHQVIKKPTHVLQNSLSGIDLIFTSQPNLAKDSGVYPSLHSNCHHQNVNTKFNLKIHLPHLTNEKHSINGKGNTELIRRTFHKFHWQSNLNIKERVYFFNKAILNIVTNFIPHETVVYDDRVYDLISDKKIISDKNYLRSGKNTKVFEEFKLLQNKIVNLTNDSRDILYQNI